MWLHGSTDCVEKKHSIMIIHHVLVGVQTVSMYSLLAYHQYSVGATARGTSNPLPLSTQINTLDLQSGGQRSKLESVSWCTIARLAQSSCGQD